MNRWHPLYEAFVLLVGGFLVGITIGAWRTSTTTDRLRAENAELRRNRDALDRFITLVVDDVERSVERAGELLTSSADFARPGAPTYPPVAYAGERWWTYNVDIGKWEPTGVEP